MTVLDLILQLQQLPQNLQVVFDAGSEDAEMFKLATIDIVDEIETADGGKYVMLSCGVEFPDPSLN